MERGYQELTGMFPRPGKALKALLVTIGVLGVANFVLFNWVQGGEEVFRALVCTKNDVVHKLALWRLLTAGLLTTPKGASSLFWTLLGLYFLSPDLEKRWGPARFLRFFATSIVVGFALALAADELVTPRLRIFHPVMMYGADAALTATAVAWSRQNANREFRLFFVVPMRGSWLLWLTVLYCALNIVAWEDNATAGVVAPVGGLITGLLLGGTPSVVRSVYLRAKLALLKKQAGGAGERPASRRPAKSTREGGPPLRVVYGGLEDELKKRKPPKDKRYLN